MGENKGKRRAKKEKELIGWKRKEIKTNKSERKSRKNEFLKSRNKEIKKNEIKMKKRNKREKGIEFSHSTSILVWNTIKIQINDQHVVDSVPSVIHINAYCMDVIIDIIIIQSNY